MKKYIFILISFLFFTNSILAQKVFYTKSGKIEFYSKTPLENIEAENNQIVSFLKTKDGSLSFGALMKSFKFKNALMEEHFNENYIESDKFPKATFKGKITNIHEIDFGKNGTYKAIVEGDLTLHGKTKRITTVATLEIDEDQINAVTSFKAKPIDFDIEIPNIVRGKIAKEITVNVDIYFKIYKK